MEYTGINKNQAQHLFHFVILERVIIISIEIFENDSVTKLMLCGRIDLTITILKYYILQQANVNKYGTVLCFGRRSNMEPQAFSNVQDISISLNQMVRLLSLIHTILE